MISQDVVVALKLLESPQWPGFARLSEALGMSLSQVHRSIARLSESRLFVESEQTIQRANLARFIVHGLPFAFPARLGEVTRGIATAWACPELKDTSLSSLVSDDLAPVWPDSAGKIKGRAIEPLHDGVPVAVQSDKESVCAAPRSSMCCGSDVRGNVSSLKPSCKGESSMSVPNLGAMRAVAERLDRVGLPYAFVGGSVVNLLIDHPELTPARPTDDLDVIIEIISGARYSDVEAQLRAVGFSHDMQPGAPKCRWMLGPLTVDIMPTEGAALGLNTAWFAEALASATVQTVAHSEFRLISPVAFLATKFTSFLRSGRTGLLWQPRSGRFHHRRRRPRRNRGRS
jgi:hypothetical protein